MAHIARDYWLGGKDHFLADREAGDEAVEAFPGLVARNTWAFLARSVRYLAGEVKVTSRGYVDVSRFFDGLELVEPGIVRASEWRPDPEFDVGTTTSTMWTGLARFR